MSYQLYSESGYVAELGSASVINSIIKTLPDPPAEGPDDFLSVRSLLTKGLTLRPALAREQAEVLAQDQQSRAAKQYLTWLIPMLEKCKELAIISDGLPASFQKSSKESMSPFKTQDGEQLQPSQKGHIPVPDRNAKGSPHGYASNKRERI